MQEICYYKKMGLGSLKGKFNFGQKKFIGEAGAESVQTFDLSDFLTADKSVTIGVRVPIGEIIVGPQREYAWGYGHEGLDPQNQGRIFIDLKDGSDVSLEGDIHLVVADNEGDRRDTVANFKLSDIRSGETKVFDRIPLTLMNPDGRGFVGFNDKLIIEYTPKATGTINATNSSGVIWGTKRKTSL